ncbi:NAD(P)H-binding protein [Actinomadura graeca]|uniref:NAD(P)H-binding protein n=1 Tax=Actinomadura graeca TaxID=2750812 RepID=A0ABX8QX82_9ACTN|nr:NAD(P)H-binding protein [Actinomadura graeca]QXJ23223.1 NAD(P)H-binding protein [Actinomadura graeca]
MAGLDRKPVLVVGARGNIGRCVLAQLLDERRPVRVSARRPGKVRFPGGVEVFAADVTEPASLRPAFEGAGRVFLYADHGSVDGVVREARAAGVERLVLLSSGSVIHPTSAGNTLTERHRRTEDAFAAAPGPPVVPIRPLVLATNALGWAYLLRTTGSVPLYRPDALTAPVHERDVAAFACAALTGAVTPALSGMLTGPVRTSQRDQVAVIGRVVGEPIPVRELSRPDALARFSEFMPVEDAEAVLRFLDDAAAGNSPATTAVEDVLGRPAIGFEQWAADHADDFS